MSSSNNYDGALTLAMPVKNLDSAQDWYAKVLGFTLLYRVDDIGWCELQTSVENVNIGLSQVEDPQPGGATPTFGVIDIEVARDQLVAAEVRMDGDIITYPGMVRLLTFYDPDGNSLMFAQSLETE